MVTEMENEESEQQSVPVLQKEGIQPLQPIPPEQLLAAYSECGQQMRFYSDARFKIITVTLTLSTVLLSAQELFSDIGFILGIIGLVSTIVLFSMEYRYNQAWFTLLIWAEIEVEDKLFGQGMGPLNSYKDIKKPWYILKSKLSTNLLYMLLMLIWLFDVLYYLNLLITATP